MDVMYKITTNGCGWVFIETAEGERLAERQSLDEVSDEAFANLVRDMLVEAQFTERTLA